MRRNSATSTPSSMMKAADSHKGDRAPDDEIVDRATDGDLADVAARKFDRIDNEGVCREGEPRARNRQRRVREPRLILHLAHGRIGESGDEHVFDEIAHRLAAATVRQRHMRRAEPARRSQMRIHATSSSCAPPYW